MSSPRFLVPDLDPSGAEVALPADESHHLARVLRLREHDEVVVFDGRGRACRARVERADHRRASVRIVESMPPDAEPRVPIVLVQSVLKGSSMDDTVRDATMVGVSRIVPVVAERSQVKSVALERAHAPARWQRIAVASAKQCGRARLPILEAPVSLPEWLREPFDGVRLLLTEPGTSSRPSRLRTVLDGSAPASVACVIGPEGGWAEEELQSATAAGCVSVSLGSLTLRADAAGLVAASIVSFLLEET